MRKSQPRKRKTITFQPDPDVWSLLTKAIIRVVGRGGNSRGVLTWVLNDSLRKQLAPLSGKRESNSPLTTPKIINTSGGVVINRNDMKRIRRDFQSRA